MESDGKTPEQNYSTNESSSLNKYPPKPIQPADEDCCGSGCSTCVFDLYDLELVKWRQRCEEIDEHGTIASLTDNADEVISVYEYKKFRLIQIEEVSKKIVNFTFEIPGNAKLPLKCGQHLVARCVSENARQVIRPYTPVSKISQRGFFKIAVKLYESGAMSKCMRGWEKGCLIDWRGPFGGHIYKPNQCEELILIAGGTGVTPMLQFVDQILSNDNDETRVKLLYSVHSADEIIAKSTIDAWTAYWNFDVYYCVTGGQRKDENIFKYGDRITYGHLSEGTLIDMKEDIQTIERNGNREVFICGSTTFNEEVRDAVVSSLDVCTECIVEFS